MTQKAKIWNNNIDHKLMQNIFIANTLLALSETWVTVCPTGDTLLQVCT
jgi:hypothetical protein